MSPSIIVDIVLVIICIAVIVKYSVKGFLKTVLDIARLALSILFAIMFRKVVARLINSLFMSKSIFNWVHGSVTKHLSGVDSKISFVNIYEKNPEFYSKVLSYFGLNFSELENSMGTLSEETAEQVSRTISEPLANMLSTLIAVIVIFTVSMIVLLFVVKLINKITSIKGINFVNRVLGIGFGAILAVIIVWAISFLLEVLIGTLGPILPNIFNESITEKSMVINFLRNLGLLDMLNGLKTRITGFIR